KFGADAVYLAGKSFGMRTASKNFSEEELKSACTAKFSFYVDSEFYEFTPDRRSVGKMLLITEEMHRLHFNTWKNFPWNDWMYEGRELGVDAK
ncbi:MAG: hypothetical protein IIZ35_06220, partial [Clostridia bacterium]|nr:hypothetical protein [Clostridia bacterium]